MIKAIILLSAMWSCGLFLLHRASWRSLIEDVSLTLSDEQERILRWGKAVVFLLSIHILLPDEILSERLPQHWIGLTIAVATLAAANAYGFSILINKKYKSNKTKRD